MSHRTVHDEARPTAAPALPELNPLTASRSLTTVRLRTDRVNPGERISRRRRDELDLGAVCELRVTVDDAVIVNAADFQREAEALEV